MKSPAGWPEWAENTNHSDPGQSWDGQPNKVAPSAGEIASGRLPRDKPPAEYTNWFRQLMARDLRHMWGYRTQNWWQGDASGIVVATAPPVATCWDPTYATVSCIMNNGNVVASIGGILWLDDADPTTGMAGGSDIGSNWGGRRVAVDAGAGDAVVYISGLGTWTASTITGAPGLNWQRCDGNDGFGGSSLFLIGESAGTVRSSPDGVTFTTVVTTNLTPSAILDIHHNKDPNNAKWMILTATETAVSSDGVTFVATAHGLSNVPTQPGVLAYDALRQRWILVHTNQDVSYSDDDGATWTTRSSILPSTPSTTARRITSDLAGEVVIAAGQEGLLFSSEDAGHQWREIYAPAAVGTPGFGTMVQFAGGWRLGGPAEGRFVAAGRPAAFETLYSLGA